LQEWTKPMLHIAH